MITIRRYSEGDEKQLRELIFPEEDRRLYTSTKWNGGFRWYRTSNVVCFEHYQRPPAKLIPRSKQRLAGEFCSLCANPSPGPS